MSYYPPPPPPYQPPDAEPPQFPYIQPPSRSRAAGGDMAIKLLVGSMVGVGVGFGTCGLGVMLSGATRAVTRVAVPLGVVLFGVSLLGVFVGSIWLLISAITGRGDR